MPHPPRPVRRLARAWALFLVLPAFVAMAADADIGRGLADARDRAGIDPQRAVAALRPLREAATAQGRLDWRLAADEIECRVLSDLDIGGALRAADAGLASAGASPPPPARLPWLRLRACRAGVLIDGGERAAEGDREIQAVLDAATDDALRPARAVALIERGVRLSRAGELLRGQQDLLAACDDLRAPAFVRDLELCQSQLGNHYKRMGDLDEAVHLFERLRDAARRRGAAYDDAIYTYGLAQVYDKREDWPQALDAYRQAAAASERLGDPSGQAYAEHGQAVALLHTSTAEQGLANIDTARRLVRREDDPKHYLRMALTRAELLVAVRRFADARDELAGIEAEVRAMGEAPALASWLASMAEVHRASGRWREGYAALAEVRAIEDKLHRQRQSEQAARLRIQYSRARDAEDIDALRRLNEQGQQLRRTQAVALALFVVLLAASSAVAWRKLRQARRLQALASTDELTGLPNRRALLARAEDALGAARRDANRVAALMIDVDHFKRINDTHGHAVGDAVLRHLARVLPAGLRSHDRLGRLGGEEFLAILPEATLPHARRVAERMREAIAATPLIAAGVEIRFTVSIGVAVGGDAGDTVASLVARADAALYRAKNGGRNAVVADSDDEPPMRAQA